jgi:DNA excision repair protein ERCC-6-like 2
MHKENDLRDLDRRFNHVSRLQDEISDNRRLPPANSLWPTALIIVPVTVMGNWQRELDTVGIIWCSFLHPMNNENSGQWGYFEVGHYSGTKDNRENVLKDFKLGRLDIGWSQ